MNEFNYQSPLKTFIEGMIREKRSLGYQYVSSARTLYRFDQFCLTYGCDDAVITHDLVHAWVQKTPNEALATLRNRASVLRQLALYMTRLGIPSYVLPQKALPKAPDYTPYIFSDQEIAALLQQADACHYCAEVPLRHHIMPLLLRLLFGCGLRISEALNLRVQDVDLHTGVLTIMDGKFNKDRWVPMSPENTQRCCDYVKVVHYFQTLVTTSFPHRVDKHSPKGMCTRISDVSCGRPGYRTAVGERGHDCMILAIMPISGLCRVAPLERDGWCSGAT